MAGHQAPDAFPAIRFRGQLRPSQAEVVEIAERKLARGQRRLHIVAPPGSGKTVLGLFLWAQCVRAPALVLSPNSAIQSQWAARIDLFDVPPELAACVSTDPARPALLTSLTYQALTMPERGEAGGDSAAMDLWRERLIAAGQAKDPDEAQVWIEDLRRHNPDYYQQRLAFYRRQTRETESLAGRSLETLHAASLASLERLKQRGIGLILLDECHHLMGHWGRVLGDAHELLDRPIVVGLTATPPDREGKHPRDVARYDEFFGEVDYEVPVPAVVKDGFLAPYQDLAWFVRPAAEELAFVARADEQLHEIVAELCRPVAPRGVPPAVPRSELRRTSDLVPPSLPAAGGEAGRETARGAGGGALAAAQRSPAETGEPLTDWVAAVLAERRLPTGPAKDWGAFERRDPQFAWAACVYLLRRGSELPPATPHPSLDLEPEDVPEMEVLAPVLDRYVRHHLRRSPRAEDHQLAERVTRRLRTLGVQITETGSQPCASPVGRVLAYSRSKVEALLPILQAEHAALGARLRAVVVADYEKTSAVSDEVSHLLDSEAGGAIAAFRRLVSWPETDALNPILVTGSSVLVDDDLAGRFQQAAGRWLLDRGCDVQLETDGEAGFHVIRGKGRDWCPRIYVALITDLFQEGLTRCLVGTRGLLGEGWDASRVNVLVDLTTATTSMTVNQLRGRSIRLDAEFPLKLADNWDVVCIAPEFSKGLDDYRRFIAKHQTLFGVADDGVIEKGVGHVHAAFTELKPEGLEGSISLLNAEMLSRAARRESARELWRIGQPYRADPVRTLETRATGDGGGFPPLRRSREPWNERTLTLAIGRAVLESLEEARLVAGGGRIHTGSRAGGYVRVFLEQAGDEDCACFIAALHEVLGPLDQPRYVIPRCVDRLHETWISTFLPRVLGRYFQRRQRRRAMLHAVPSALARNKERVEIFERAWNRFVSPGQAVYAHRGAGLALIAEARQRGQVPRGAVHQKEVFL